MVGSPKKRARREAQEAAGGRKPKPASKAAGKANAAPALLKARKAAKPGKTYTPALAHKICMLLAEGKSIRAISAMPGMPPKSTVIDWAMNPSHPFAELYDRARQVAWRVMADEMIELADDSSRDLVEREDGSFAIDHANVNRAKLQIDTRKWILAKMMPKQYGDRYSIGGDAAEPLRIQFIPGDERL